MSLRPVKQIIQPKPTIEGAGVKLQRAFGFGKTKDFEEPVACYGPIVMNTQEELRQAMSELQAGNFIKHR